MGSLVTKNVTAMDFFAKPVTMTFRGHHTHKSFAGGCVTIIIVAILVLGSIQAFVKQLTEPEYSSFPTQYSYSLLKKPELGINLHTNLLAYRLQSINPLDALSHLRLQFLDEEGQRIPVVRCEELVQEEIEAEK